MSAAPRITDDAPQHSYPALPFEPELEQALLGAMILFNDRIAEIRPLCAAEDFHEPLHRRIAAAIFALSDENRPVTPLTLKAQLGTDDALASVGGHAYLAGLAEFTTQAPATQATQLARSIAEVALRRSAMIACWDAQERLARPDRRITEIMAPLVAASDRAAEREDIETGTIDAGETAAALILAVETGDTTVIGEPVCTGLVRIDDVIGGLYPANLVIVAGRPGMGKSSLGTTFARAASNAGFAVEYFSLEMTRAELVARIITDLDYDRFDANISKPLSYSRLLKRRCSAAEIARGRAAAELMGVLDISIHDRSLSMPDITALARARAARSKAQGVVIIDHLQIVRPSDRYRGNRTAEITEMTGQAKALAKQLGWPVVLLSQLNREVEKRHGKEKKPTLADLRESGSIEQDADVVLLLHRPAYYIKRPPLGPRDPDWTDYLAAWEPVQHHLDIDIAKNRHGETDVVKCFVEIGASAVRDADPRAAPARNDDDVRGLLA